MTKSVAAIIFVLFFLSPAGAQSDSPAGIISLKLPERSGNAPTGSEFARRISDLKLEDREKAVVREILSGNVPSFSRRLKAIKISRFIKGIRHDLVYHATCDYMAVGSDSDYLYIPMTPSTAQYLADRLNCSLPTKKIVDDIYHFANNKLTPQPIPPSDKMTTVAVFLQHTDSIRHQIRQKGINHSAETFWAGHKKDIIISNKIYSADRNYKRVVIYGWHLGENNPIQPVYNGHGARYADYSHGVRLISRLAFLDADSIRTDHILTDTDMSVLLSDEGRIARPRYPASDFLTTTGHRMHDQPSGFLLKQNYPNPFNPSTTIFYRLLRSTVVDLSIFNLQGKKIKTLVAREQSAGQYKVEWKPFSRASGIYIYRLKTGFSEKSGKMIMLR